jgi:hypothetical protein
MTNDEAMSPMNNSMEDEKKISEGSMDETTSALQDNLDRKGKNAYYFAHAHKATGPKWDGKPEPKLLKKESTSSLEPQKRGAFDYHKSNITSYAFCDEEKKVKLYCNMEGVGDTCTEEDVTLDFTESSLQLVVRNYKEEDQILSFGKLTANITKATFKIKPNRIILTLTKATDGEWHTINDKGAPDHDLL